MQEVILKALSGEMHWFRAADILASPTSRRRRRSPWWPGWSLTRSRGRSDGVWEDSFPDPRFPVTTAFSRRLTSCSASTSALTFTATVFKIGSVGSTAGDAFRIGVKRHSARYQSSKARPNRRKRC